MAQYFVQVEKGFPHENEFLRPLRSFDKKRCLRVWLGNSRQKTKETT